MILGSYSLSFSRISFSFPFRVFILNDCFSIFQFSVCILPHSESSEPHSEASEPHSAASEPHSQASEPHIPDRYPPGRAS